MNTSHKEINILLATDIHESTDNVKKLAQWVIDNKKNVDYILLLGDIVTVPNLEQNLMKSMQAFEPKIKELIIEFEKICSNVLYIGGNHEPKSLFEDNPPVLTEKSINMHKKYFKLANDLYIIGVGGSTPILTGKYVEPNVDPFQHINLQQFKFAGYPYNTNDDYVLSDKELGDNLRKVLKDVRSLIKKDNMKEPQMILMSHNGPLYTMTNWMVMGNNENQENLFLGSQQLGNIFYEDNSIFLDIHGHTHSSKGIITTNFKTVINPGDLETGNFGMITLKKSHLDEWFISNECLYSLK